VNGAEACYVELRVSGNEMQTVRKEKLPKMRSYIVGASLWWAKGREYCRVFSSVVIPAELSFGYSPRLGFSS